MAVVAFAVLAIGPEAGEARMGSPSPAWVACAGLPGMPTRIAYAAPEASACCAQDAACARLLATTVIRRAHGDLHT